MEFLDNVLQYFIDNAPNSVERARYSALRERSIGIGALGFHAYLQSKRIPIESVLAKSINYRMFSHIKEECARGDEILCEKRGPCPDAKDAGIPRRFSHWNAVAPNASSSLIMAQHRHRSNRSVRIFIVRTHFPVLILLRTRCLFLFLKSTG